MKALLLLLALLPGVPPARALTVPADAEVFHLRWELERAAWLPDAADWRARLLLESGAWSLRGGLARTDGEIEAAPHRALWVGCRLPAGWRLGLGDQLAATEAGAALGRGRGGLPARLAGGLRLRPGTASSWQPEDRGLSVSRETGPLRGGLLLAATRRDATARGDGFLLDLEHGPATKERLGAWRDRLGLVWLTRELRLGWEAHGLVGRRWTPAGEIALDGLQLLRRTTRGCLGLAWEEGEARLAQVQAGARWRGGWWQADVWRGRAGRLRYARPALHLGAGRPGSGLALQGAGRVPGIHSASLVLSLRWLGATARTTERSALWWRLQLERGPGRGQAGPRLRVTRTAAEDRPAGSGRDAWRVELEPATTRGLDWRLAWEDLRRPAGDVRLWHLTLRGAWQRPGWRGGAQLHLLSGAGGGPARLEALALAPGLLRHAALSGRRQAWGGGLWLERGPQRLSLGLLMREEDGTAGGAPLEQVPLVQIAWRCDVR